MIAAKVSALFSSCGKYDNAKIEAEPNKKKVRFGFGDHFIGNDPD